jgi:hypothetical protein
MGSLTPGATLIYERVGEKIYSREFGKNKRNLVGYTSEMTLYRSQINQVLLMCEQDPDMRQLLDKLFVLYNLKCKND